MSLVLITLIVILLSLFIGRYPEPGLMSPKQLFFDELAIHLFLNLRLPRLLASLLLGSALAASGMVFQMLFNNPLVEPGFLGVSQGAAFGAALCIIFLGGNAVAVQGLAVLCALLGLFTSYLLARHIRYGGWVLRLVLSGITVSALFSAGLGLLKYMADPLSQLPEITFWLLGGLSGTTWPRFLSVLPGVAIGLFVVYLYRWRINVLSLNEDVAFSLGISTTRERMLLLIAAVFSTASIISVAGIVSWIGLIVPHLARRFFGSDARLAIPASILIGGIFSVVCDTAARSMFTGEIPLGILTSLLGTLSFLILMTSRGFRIQR